MSSRVSAKVAAVWDAGEQPWPRPVAAVLAGAYRGAVSAREWLYRRGVLRSQTVGVPVVSIGNVTVGGTGKTPAVELAVQTLKGLGHRPAVVSRGYRRQSRGVQVVADAASIRLEGEDAGDEPFLLARRLPGIPVVVGANRAEAVKVARDRFDVTAIVLDDGLQHRTLRKDLEIVMARARRPWGNGRLLPAGPLREPLQALARADLVVAAGAGSLADATEVAAAIDRYAPGRAAARRAVCARRVLGGAPSAGDSAGQRGQSPAAPLRGHRVARRVPGDPGRAGRAGGADRRLSRSPLVRRARSVRPRSPRGPGGDRRPGDHGEGLGPPPLASPGAAASLRGERAPPPRVRTRQLAGRLRPRMPDAVVVRLPNWLGDTVMAVPALRALRRQRPEARVTLAGPWASLLVGQGLGDVLVDYPRSWAGRLRAADSVRSLGGDLAVLLPNSFEAALAARYWGARGIVGFASGGRSWLLTEALPVPSPRRHQVDEYLMLVEHLGAATPDRAPALASPDPEGPQRREVRALLQGIAPEGGGARHGPRIGVHLGAAYGAAKRWPLERIVDFCRLLAPTDRLVVLLGTSADRDVADAVVRAAPALNLAGRDRPELLPAMLAELDVLVCGDTGVAHLAAALGTPVVALFGPTDPALTGPRGPATVLHHPVACAPCFYRTCPIDHPCLRGIEAPAVHARVERALAARVA